MSTELAEMRKDINKLTTTVSNMQTLMDTVFKRMGQDIAICKANDEKFNSFAYESCDAKTKEIHTEVEKAKKLIEEEFNRRINVLAEVTEKRLQLVYWVIGSLWALFIAYVAYDNYQLGVVHEKINKVNETVVANSTKLDIVVVSITELRNDLKDKHEHKRNK